MDIKKRQNGNVDVSGTITRPIGLNLILSAAFLSNVIERAVSLVKDGALDGIEHLKTFHRVDDHASKTGFTVRLIEDGQERRVSKDDIAEALVALASSSSCGTPPELSQYAMNALYASHDGDLDDAAIAVIVMTAIHGLLSTQTQRVIREQVLAD